MSHVVRPQPGPARPGGAGRQTGRLDVHAASGRLISRRNAPPVTGGTAVSPRRLKVLVALTLLLGAFGTCLWIYVGTSFSCWMTAKRLYERGDYAHAVPAFRRFLRMQPDDADGHYWLAHALGITGKPD